jgi:hypothetical protein
MRVLCIGALIACLSASTPALAEDAASAQQASTAAITDRQALERVRAMFSSACGLPNRCSLMRDARGACGHTVIIQLPTWAESESRQVLDADQQAKRLFWVCLTEWGGLLDVHQGREAPWRKG